MPLQAVPRQHQATRGKSATRSVTLTGGHAKVWGLIGL